MKEANSYVALALIVGAWCVLMYCSLTNGHDWGDDFAQYIMQARSLTEKAPQDFIEANRFTVERSSSPIGVVAYPWGFPLLLAPFYAVFGLNLLALKAVNGLCYALFLVLIWFGFRRFHPHSWLFCLACLFALHPGLLGLADSITSDMLFLVLSTLSLVIIRAVVIEQRRLLSRFWDSVLIGAVIAASFMVRMNGLLILASLGFSQLLSWLQQRSQEWRRNMQGGECSTSPETFLSVRNLSAKPLFVILVPYAVFICLVIAWDWALPAVRTSYLSYLHGISIRMIAAHLCYYVALAATFFHGVPFHRLIYTASIPFAVFGAIRRGRSDYPVALYIALTVLLYSVWPSLQGGRYLAPIFPFYLSFACSGLEAFQCYKRPVQKRFWKLIWYLPVVLVILFWGLHSIDNAYRNMNRHRENPTGAFTPASKSMFSFIAKHTEAESTIIFFKPRAMRLMTDRKSIMINKEQELARGEYLCWYSGDAEGKQVSATVVDDMLRKGTARLIYENINFRVYRLEAAF